MTNMVSGIAGNVQGQCRNSGLWPGLARGFASLVELGCLVLVLAGTGNLSHAAAVTSAPMTASSTSQASPFRTMTTVRRIRLENHSINPITTRFMLQNLEQAEKEGSAFLLELDTLGGLLSSTKEIVKRFLGAKVPVIVYVSPNGGSATSAGAYITIAAHVAAMAPSTHIGAATPISMDGSGEKPRRRGVKEKETTGTQTGDAGSTQPSTIRIVVEGDGTESESAAAAKSLNDTAAWSEATAKARGRNAEWARDIVYDARSSTADDAFRLGVIDLIATSTADLYRALNGRTVQTMDGKVTINLENTALTPPIELNTQERFLDFLADPTIAYLLISLGTLCIFIEFYNPGLIVPGLIGLISLMLAAVSLNILPINTLAVVLLVVGVGLILLEVKFPLFFVPTVGGIAFLIVGALMLIDEPRILPGGYVPLGVAAGLGGASGGLLALMVWLTFRVHRSKVLTGAGSYRGELAEVSEDLSPKGTVYFAGTYWSAMLVGADLKPLITGHVPKGDRVEVVRVQGLRADVKPLHLETTQ